MISDTIKSLVARIATLAAGKAGSRRPGEYFDLMGAVRRVVPRR
jgi:hypothetical protein